MNLQQHRAWGPRGARAKHVHHQLDPSGASERNAAQVLDFRRRQREGLQHLSQRWETRQIGAQVKLAESGLERVPGAKRTPIGRRLSDPGGNHQGQGELSSGLFERPEQDEAAADQQLEDRGVRCKFAGKQPRQPAQN